MAIERGIVKEILGSHALVISTKSSSCESCSSKDACNVMGGGNEVEIEALNTVHAEAGDTVLISFQTSSLFKLTFLLYIFPIIFLFMGAIVGEKLSIYAQADPSKISAIFSFVLFFISLGIVILVSRKLEKKQEYKPEIIKVVAKGFNQKCHNL